MISTTRELSEAATDGPSHFAVGPLDDGVPPQHWRSLLVANPSPILLSKGTFSFDAELQVESEALGTSLENMVRASHGGTPGADWVPNFNRYFRRQLFSNSVGFAPAFAQNLFSESRG